MRICTILGFSCANLTHVQQFSPRFQLADVLPAKAASCRSWFAFAQGNTVRYAVGRLGTRSHAFLLHGTRVGILATVSDTQLP